MRISRSFTALTAALFALQPIALQASAGQDTDTQEPPIDPIIVEGEAEEFVGPHQPADKLERSLWLQMDEFERDLQTSKQVIHDPALNEYVRGVLCRTVGPECEHIRLYIMRSPYFNATMAPNGMMQVWSGLLLRTQNEAQLAAVLGHEFAHFKQKHGLQIFRKAKDKSNTAAWLAFTGVGLLFSIGLYDSLFRFSREQEEEADLDGLEMIRAAGYDPREVPRIWKQLLDESDATREARGRKKKKRKTKGGLFDTHPPSQARVDYLEAAIAAYPEVSGETGEERYRSAMRDLWPQFLDDQLKLNDHGGSEFLIEVMGEANGWNPWLTYARAEFHRRRGHDGDFETAIEFYSQAIAAGGELPELWRGRGYALRKLGRKEEAKPDFAEYLKREPEAPDRAMVAMLAGGVS